MPVKYKVNEDSRKPDSSSFIANTLKNSETGTRRHRVCYVNVVKTIRHWTGQKINKVAGTNFNFDKLLTKNE